MKRFYIITLVIVVICGMVFQEASSTLNFGDLALSKPATMSSTWNSKYGPDRAVDGNLDGNFFSGSCTLTKDYKGWHWWQVDLQDTYSITTVRITNRNDCCSFRLRDFAIEVSEDEPSTLPGFPGTTNATVCLTRKDTIPISEPYLLECDKPAIGRYLRIIKESIKGMPLTLCAVEVFGNFFRGLNLAFGKPTTQSNQNYDEKKYENMYSSPNTAVDVNGNGNFKSGSCSHNKIGGAWNWWQVDLQDVYEILAVRITNRNDCCGYRLQDFAIEVSYEEPSTLTGFPRTTKAAVCLTRKDANPSLGSYILDCDQPVKGRYLRIVKESDEDTALTLCEVEVYGRFSRGPNIAVGRPTRQSSTYDTAVRYAKGYSYRAVDGNVYSLFMAGSCTQTVGNENWSWWQVDLQDMYNISAVRISNRVECCSDRLQDFTIEVSEDEPSTLPGFPGTTNAAICLTRKDTIPNSGPFMLQCDKPIKGRFLRIVKKNVKRLPFTLCEVEVYEPFEERINMMNGKNGLWRFIYIAHKGSMEVFMSSTKQEMIDCARQRLGDRTDLYTNPYILFDFQTGSCSFHNTVPERSLQYTHNWIVYKVE